MIVWGRAPREPALSGFEGSRRSKAPQQRTDLHSESVIIRDR